MDERLAVALAEAGVSETVVREMVELEITTEERLRHFIRYNNDCAISKALLIPCADVPGVVAKIRTVLDSL